MACALGRNCARTAIDIRLWRRASRRASDDLGTLEVGKLAIVLLDANPLEDIKNTQMIWRVIKGGFVFDPDELRKERN